MSQSPVRFKVVNNAKAINERQIFYLIKIGWDDWFSYSTTYELIFVSDSGRKIEIGILKIGEQGLEQAEQADIGQTGVRYPTLPDDEFNSLSELQFSVGQSADYYKALQDLNTKDTATGYDVLRALNDLALNDELWTRFRNENVTQVSLLREISTAQVEVQFRRIAQGGAVLTPYKLRYTAPPEGDQPESSLALTFEVLPNSVIPTNLHVLIGRNGVGKTHILSLITQSLIAESEVAAKSGSVSIESDGAGIANVITVSFSAFDTGEIYPDRKIDSNQVGYTFIGLRGGGQNQSPKSPSVLAEEFADRLRDCLRSSKRELWIRTIEQLSSDPMFSSARILAFSSTNWANSDSVDDVKTRFSRLSSGHKIVLLSVTCLVAKAEEKTLVLIDEPESYLHPPLLSAFVRALSDLLVHRNSIALVATHSPVVLQEVPRTCTWILNRFGTTSIVNRPSCETFAENIDTLTREVFQLEVIKSGYHKLLAEICEREESYELAMAQLQSIGFEGRAILKALYANKIADNKGLE